MSIQLDGHLTYPNERDFEEERSSAHVVGDSSNDDTDGAPSSIGWEGFWRYSKKRSKAGHELCRFKYFFVGPVEKSPDGVDGSKPTEKQQDAAGGGSGGGGGGGGGSSSAAVVEEQKK